MEIHSINTNTLLPQVIDALLRDGISDHSRNGPVLRFPEPVTIRLARPWERVNFSPYRDANPFFHLMEALAMLNDTNDAPFLAHFAKNMMNYSDDGRTFNAFYGTRARTWRTKASVYPPDIAMSSIDQLDAVIENLHKNPGSRQEVVYLGDPWDLRHDTKDKACNLALVFSLHPSTQAVRMTSFNRSNDLIWGGVCGANIVHLSMFQEYVACSLGKPTGDWWHTSANLHVYTDNPTWTKLKESQDAYDHAYPRSMPLFVSPLDRSHFDVSLRKFMWCAREAVSKNRLIMEPEVVLKACPFIRNVALPVFNTWQIRKIMPDKPEHAYACSHEIASEDWRKACQGWLSRRDQR